MNRTPMFVALLLAWSVGGCQKQGEADLPVGPRDEARRYHAERLRLRDGQTTAGEVRSVMGAADYLNADASFVAYYWETVSAALAAPGFDDDDLNPLRQYTRHLLAMRFDEQGLLVRHKHRKLRPSRDLARQLDMLVRKWAVDTPLPADRTAPGSDMPSGGDRDR